MEKSCSPTCCAGPVLHYFRFHNDLPWRQDVVEEGFTVEKQGRIVRPNIDLSSVDALNRNWLLSEVIPMLPELSL